jgi:putative transcriptional regulator
MNVTPNHHLDDATLVAFAAGTLPRHLRIVAASHLESCAECRSVLRYTAELGAALALDAETEAVKPELKDAVMAEVDTATLHRLPVARTRRPSDLPRALATEIGVENLDQLKWRICAPGVEMVKLPKAPGERGFFGLLRVKPGAQLPDHGHGGTELTLVLQGSYHDELGQFREGDIADLDAAVQHNPVADTSGICVCLVANDAPTRFRSFAARLMQPFIGI